MSRVLSSEGPWRTCIQKTSRAKLANSELEQLQKTLHLSGMLGAGRSPSTEAAIFIIVTTELRMRVVTFFVFVLCLCPVDLSSVEKKMIYGLLLRVTSEIGSNGSKKQYSLLDLSGDPPFPRLA